MDRKKLLTISTSLIVLIGIGFICSIFIGAWKMPADAGESLIRFNPHDLEGKSHIVIDSGFDSPLRYKYLILKTNESLRVLGLYSRDDKFLMPWKNAFWDASGYCQNLIIENEIISCGDPNIEEWQREGWQWSLDGENLAQQFGDFELVDYAREGALIAIGKKES